MKYSNSRNYLIRHIVILISLSIYAFGVNAEQEAIILSDTPLKESASNASKDLYTLNKDSLVTLKQRKGGWYQVSADQDQVGWVRMLRVRFLSKQEANEHSIAKLLRETAIMPPASGKTTGVRGITEGNLIQSDKASLSFDQMKDFVPDETEVRKFGENGSLATESKVQLELTQ